MPYLTKPKGGKLCPRQVEIKIHKVQQKEVKAVKKVNQQILDIKHSQQSMASGSEQQQHKGQQPSTSEKTHHIPETCHFYPGMEWMDDVLNTAEHYSGSERLSSATEYL